MVNQTLFTADNTYVTCVKVIFWFYVQGVHALL